MSRSSGVHELRILTESWRIAAGVSFIDPDVLVDPYGDSAGRGLVLHKPHEGGSIALSERTGMRVAGPGGVSEMSWRAIFARRTSSIVAEAIDNAVWGQGSAAITTTPAASAYLGIASAFTLAAPLTNAVTVLDGWTLGGGAAHGRLLPLDPFWPAVRVAAEENEVALVDGLTLRLTRWWLMSIHGTPKVVFDDQEGMVFTRTRSIELPRGEGVDARKAIFKIMCGLLVDSE